jgi:membrane protein DedA with SNARE-associated domain
MWNLLWVGPRKGNPQVFAGIGAIAGEWQNFVSGRLREDFAFVRRVAQSRSPEQIWAAYVEFWQRAVEDYGKEYMTIGRLAAGVRSQSA